MKKQVIKKVRKVTVESEVRKPSVRKPKKKLSKADPDYYKIIGQISAKRRKISSEQFAEWGRKSHEKRTKKSYRNAGRKPKEDAV